MKKNILIIHYHKLDLPGGSQSIVKTILFGLKKKYRLSVLTLSEKNFEKYIKDGIVYYGSFLLSNESKVNPKKLKELLDKICKEFFPDLVYTHNLSYMFNLGKAKRIFSYFYKKGIPLVEHTHHACARRKRRIKEMLNLDWDKIIAISEFAYKKIRKFLKDKKKLVKIRNFINLKLFKKLKKRKRNKLLKKIGIKQKEILLFPSRPVRISTGKIGRQKQFKTVLKALKLLKKKGKDFCVIVPSLSAYHKNKNIEKDFKRILEKFGLVDNVKIFPELLPQEQMYRFYSLGKIVLFPSLNESFGLVVLESMAMGLPIIVARSGALPEIVKNNYNGIIIKPGDYEGLTEAIEKLLTNKKLYKKISKNALSEAKKYDLKKHIGEIEKIFENAMKKRRIIYLVRHATTRYNEEGRFLGQKDVEITKKGLEEIKNLKSFFKNVKIDKVYSSDLKRCLITAKAISRKRPIVRKELREIDVGELEGKTHREIRKEFPKIYKRIYSLKKYPKGESLKELEKRLKKFLKTLDFSKVNVIVGHATVNRMIKKILLKEKYDLSFHQKSNEITKLDLKKKKFEIIRLS